MDIHSVCAYERYELIDGGGIQMKDELNSTPSIAKHSLQCRHISIQLSKDIRDTWSCKRQVV